MRRASKLGLAVVAAAVAASAAFASPVARQASTRVDCHAKAVTFLFWPQGHAAIPRLGFPDYPYPHMEVYKTAHGTYPDPNELAIIEFTQSGQPAGGIAKTCTKTAARIIDSRPAKAKTTVATTLRCAFPRSAQLDYKKTNAPTGVSLTATLASKGVKAPLAVQATMTVGSSVLRFNPKLCKAFKPPQ